MKQWYPVVRVLFAAMLIGSFLGLALLGTGAYLYTHVKVVGTMQLISVECINNDVRVKTTAIIMLKGHFLVADATAYMVDFFGDERPVYKVYPWDNPTEYFLIEPHGPSDIYHFRDSEFVHNYPGGLAGFANDAKVIYDNLPRWDRYVKSALLNNMDVCNEQPTEPQHFGPQANNSSAILVGEFFSL